jgi:hypothetical protein
LENVPNFYEQNLLLKAFESLVSYCLKFVRLLLTNFSLSFRYTPLVSVNCGNKDYRRFVSGSQETVDGQRCNPDETMFSASLTKAV